MRNTMKAWASFFGGIFVIISFIAFMNMIIPFLKGPLGSTVRNNMEKNIEATALIYSESGDIHDYLDRDGKYGLDVSTDISNKP